MGVGYRKMERMGESQNTIKGSMISDLKRVNFFFEINIYYNLYNSLRFYESDEFLMYQYFNYSNYDL